MKNILGIAAGICDGLGFGDNAKASLLTRGWVPRDFQDGVFGDLDAQHCERD